MVHNLFQRQDTSVWFVFIPVTGILKMKLRYCEDWVKADPKPLFLLCSVFSFTVNTNDILINQSGPAGDLVETKIQDRRRGTNKGKKKVTSPDLLIGSWSNQIVIWLVGKDKKLHFFNTNRHTTLKVKSMKHFRRPLFKLVRISWLNLRACVSGFDWIPNPKLLLFAELNNNNKNVIDGSWLLFMLCMTILPLFDK